MANKFVVIPEEIYRGLTASDTGNINLDFSRHQLDKVKKERADSSAKNIHYNQELRRYLHLLKEHQGKPINVAITGDNDHRVPIPPPPPIAQPRRRQRPQRRPPPPSFGGDDDDDDLFPPPPGSDAWMDDSYDFGTHYEPQRRGRKRRGSDSNESTNVSRKRMRRARTRSIRRSSTSSSSSIPRSSRTNRSQNSAEQNRGIHEVLNHSNPNETDNEFLTDDEDPYFSADENAPSTSANAARSAKRRRRFDDDVSSYSSLRKRRKISLNFRQGLGQNNSQPIRRSNGTPTARIQPEPASRNIDETEDRIDQILTIINRNPREYNVNGERILRRTGSVFQGSNVRASLRYLLERRDGRSLGKAPIGTHIFEQRISENPQIVALINPQLRGIKRRAEPDASEGVNDKRKWVIRENPNQPVVPAVKSILKKTAHKRIQKKKGSNKRKIKWASVRPTPQAIHEYLDQNNSAINNNSSNQEAASTSQFRPEKWSTKKEIKREIKKE